MERMTMKMRIRIYDKFNWCLEEEVPGGKLIEKGPMAGKVTKDKWRVVGYYPNVKFAALAMLDKAALYETFERPDEIVKSIDKARADVLAAINALEPVPVASGEPL